MQRTVSFLIALFLCAATASATTFIVPTDEEMVARANAIVVGTVEGSYTVESNGVIETTYEIRVTRRLKGGSRPGDLIEVTSPGGMLEDRGVRVVGSPHFANGDRALLFLSGDRSGWRITDMTLGKFRFVTSTTGEHLLVRDMEDVVGWDHDGRVHRENVRREAGFLRFIEEHVNGRPAAQDYVVSAADVTLAPQEQQSGFTIVANAPFPGPTYTAWTHGQPIRWENMAAGVTFFKRSGYNISGQSDGGATVIRNGLAAWNNEPGSCINLQYGGERDTASAAFDGISVVEFNDPQQRISGSWGGAGTIAYTFLSFTGTHNFAGTTWWSINDADVVFQDGYPGTHPAFGVAMTHELGHGIGWRHSNEHYLDETACQPSVEECTSAAIMNSVVNGNYGYNLQPWDVNAAQSVYPGTCGTTPPPTCTPPSITSQPTSRTINSGTSTTLTVTANGTTPLSYQWYIGPSGTTSNPVPNGTGSSITVSPTSTTSYWVRVSNACGSVNSSAATVTVNQPQPASVRGDFNGDGRVDLIWRHRTTGQNAIWFMNGTTYQSSTLFESVTDLNWRIEAAGDFNRDGRTDLVWRNVASGNAVVWLMNGTTRTSSASLGTVETNWQIAGAGDFDRDGNVDLFWRNYATGQNAVWLMSGTTLRSSVMTSTADLSWRAEGVGDFDRDGNADVVWRNTSSGQNAIWLMSGTSIRSSVLIPTVTDQAWNIEAVGDYNGDSWTDLVWRNYGSGQNAIWLFNGTTYNGSVTIQSSTDPNWQMVGPR